MDAQISWDEIEQELQSQEIKRRENKIRRNLSQRGFRVQKTPRGHWSLNNVEPGYRVVSDFWFDNVVLGDGFGGYRTTLEDVERFAGCRNENGALVY